MIPNKFEDATAAYGGYYMTDGLGSVMNLTFTANGSVNAFLDNAPDWNHNYVGKALAPAETIGYLAKVKWRLIGVVSCIGILALMALLFSRRGSSPEWVSPTESTAELLAAVALLEVPIEQIHVECQLTFVDSDGGKGEIWNLEAELTFAKDESTYLSSTLGPAGQMPDAPWMDGGPTWRYVDGWNVNFVRSTSVPVSWSGNRARLLGPPCVKR